LKKIDKDENKKVESKNKDEKGRLNRRRGKRQKAE
jgi:hypothetical protein